MTYDIYQSIYKYSSEVIAEGRLLGRHQVSWPVIQAVKERAEYTCNTGKKTRTESQILLSKGHTLCSLSIHTQLSFELLPGKTCPQHCTCSVKGTVSTGFHRSGILGKIVCQQQNHPTTRFCPFDTFITSTLLLWPILIKVLLTMNMLN